MKPGQSSILTNGPRFLSKHEFPNACVACTDLDGSVSAEEPTLPPGWWKVVNVKGAVGYIHPVAKATSDTWPGTG